MRTDQPDCDNWILLRIPYALWALAILLLALSFAFSLTIIGAIVFIVAFGYVTYARYRLSPRGGDLQAHIREACYAA